MSPDLNQKFLKVQIKKEVQVRDIEPAGTIQDFIKKTWRNAMFFYCLFFYKMPNKIIKNIVNINPKTDPAKTSIGLCPTLSRSIG